MSVRLQLQVEQHRYVPGDAVSGTILVLEAGGSRSLEALLEYNEETDDYREVAISISSGPLHEGDLTAGTSFEFELTLPQDALPSYQSEHGELYWQVDAKSNEFGRDTHDRSRIEVERPGAVPAGEGFAPPSGPEVKKVSPVGFRRRARKGGRWVWGVFFGAGVVALIAGAAILVHTVQFVTKAEQATGTVVDLKRETDSEGDETFYPVVRFATAEGREIEFVSGIGSDPPSESPGDRVDVLYDPDDPNDAELSGFFNIWSFPAIPLILGAAFVGVGLFIRRHMRQPSGNNA